MLEIKFDTSELERAKDLLRRFPEMLVEAMRKANVQSAAHVLTTMKRSKLVGGNPLNRRTGNLIRSWAVIPPVRESNGWKGGVGSNCDYAAAHEFGVDKEKSVNVRAHTRKVASRDTLREGAASSLKTRKTRGVLSEGIAFVHTFVREQHTKIPARPYARPAFLENAGRITATHHDNIRQAWEKAK